MKMNMKKRICALILTAACAVSLYGCGKDQVQENKENTGLGQAETGADEADTDTGQENDNTDRQPSDQLDEQSDDPSDGTVELTVWGAQEDDELMQQVLDSFQNEYKDQAEFEITYEAQGESGCKDVLLGDLEQGADVFAFADDQLNALAAAGAIEPIEQAETVRPQHLERAVEAACVGDTMYAYPLTADNGYFLYYNKQFFSDEDVKSLERILDIAADNGKFFSMDWSSAWYVYSFFGNTGMEIGLNEDGLTNYCTWNAQEGEIKGIDVAQSMMNAAASPGFKSIPDGDFINHVQNGSVIAGISGAWNAVAVEEIWGKDTGAARLPEYSCNGKQVQMASFSGCKLIGVNAYSKHRSWAEKLAAWIVSEPNQKLRFEMRGQGPSNIKVAESEEVQQSAAISALLDQSGFSQLQRVGGKFWEPVEAFAAEMAQGNPSGEDLQKQLDEMVEKVMAR